MRLVLSLALVLTSSFLFAQRDFYDDYTFSRADTLRGSLRPERTAYDVTFYELDLTVDHQKRSITGSVDMHYRVVEPFTTLQVDLYENMSLDQVTWRGQALEFERVANAVFVKFPSTQSAETDDRIRMHYHGQPTVARNAPWDGGFVWGQDQKKRPWIAVACEGDGASLWWPNKDHLSDEPDSMAIKLTVADRFVAVANGNLRKTVPLKKTRQTRYEWFVSYPIDNYNVTLNIGHYTHFHDVYTAENQDTLALDYYVMDYNEDRAREHFKQTHQVLACYEHYMDRYPFWEDGFALVETPYLGMEHQGAIAYGNKYMRGYLGGMIPRDMQWDYIIVHEAGHEYYGNSIGVADLAEMWIQESFTTYLEALFVEYTMSYADAVRYLDKQKLYILNQEPVLGPLGVNWEDWDGSDHYFKGAWILHTLRHAIGDDEKWFQIFKGFYRNNALSLVTTQDFLRYVNEQTDRDWTAFFEQYLYYPQVPTLEYQLTEKDDQLLINYRWQADVADFAMPVRVGTTKKRLRITPKVGEWQEFILFNAKKEDFRVATSLFLIKMKEVKN
ncbi:MAG: M1 family metallopeptidase [Bacteroidota bacterium]